CTLLKGIKIIDLTRVVAGPCCTRTLADLGAEVLKIEPPDGDLFRRGVPKVDDIPVMYTQQNAGKRHLSIDLSQERGQALLRELAAECDVIVENYRPGVANRLGIGYEQICEVKPDIVYCSITGYGQDGPAAQRRAYAPIIHAELGLVALNARERETAPMPEAVSHADFAAGAQGVIGVLAAIVHRLRTGEGQHVDVSMAETMLAVNEWSAVEVNGGLKGEISPFKPGKALILQLKDDSWIQVPGNPASWIFRIADILGKTEELTQHNWHTPTDTEANMPEVKAVVQRWALEGLLEEALDKARMPVGQVASLDNIINTDWAQARGAFVDVGPEGESVNIPKSPLRFSKAEVGPTQGARLRGADNRTVLSEILNLSEESLDELEASGVLSKT
ncbi:MAG: CaiB/BaiF CoA-transferase family protein, partial [Pseudomonadota bacterium]